MAVVRRGIEVFWRALVARARRRPKSLVLVESSALGDRRFVSVVQFERQRFLIGSSPSAVTLLARLPNAGDMPCDGGASAAHEESQSQ
ncbi:MAG: flagellar biosynthetic protein FliO [Terriglobales bacterium]